MTGPFRDLTPAQVAAISARNRASRTHRLTDTGVHESREPKNAQDALGRAGSLRSYPDTTEAPETQATQLESKNPAILGVNLTLPWPPTVNHYWKLTKTGKVYIGEPGRAFRAKVKMLAEGVPMTTGRLEVTLLAFPPDARRRDLDNLAKAALDALQHAGLIQDDAFIDLLTIERSTRHPFGKLEVTIRARKPSPLPLV